MIIAQTVSKNFIKLYQNDFCRLLKCLYLNLNQTTEKQIFKPKQRNSEANTFYIVQNSNQD